MSKLHLVYTVVDDFSDFTMTVIGGCFFVSFTVFIAVYIVKKRIPIRQIFSLSKDDIWLKIALTGFCFSTFVLLCEVPSVIPTYFNMKNVYQNNKMYFVEGKVTNFHPRPGDGHGDEYFNVGGVWFQYSDLEEGIGGYHKPTAQGGIFRPDLYVRIGYYPTDFRNIILKIEAE